MTTATESHLELDRPPGRWWLQRQQGEPLGEFLLRLLDEWAKERASLGQESPVLSVKALALNGRPALEATLRNGSRWIVPRRQDDGKVSPRKGVYLYGGEER